MSDIIKYDRHDAVAVITLHRPESMNSFNTELRAALVDAFAKAREDDSVRAVVFTGEGRCFSAGADLNLNEQVGNLNTSRDGVKQRIVSLLEKINQIDV